MSYRGKDVGTYRLQFGPECRHGEHLESGQGHPQDDRASDSRSPPTRWQSLCPQSTPPFFAPNHTPAFWRPYSHPRIQLENVSSLSQICLPGVEMWGVVRSQKGGGGGERSFDAADDSQSFSPRGFWQEPWISASSSFTGCLSLEMARLAAARLGEGGTLMVGPGS